jgi:hypothetical protein
MFASSVLLGLAGGATASLLERRGWLRNQARTTPLAPRQAIGGTCGCGQAAPTLVPSCACTATAPAPAFRVVRVTLGMATGDCCAAAPVMMPVVPVRAPGAGTLGAAPARRFDIMVFLTAVFGIAKRLVPMFLGFAFIGYLLNGLIPSSWVSAIFGGGNAYSVPLAATLGLPLYVNSEASLPLVRSLLDAGMSPGAAMAFLITGAGTSIGAIVGALTIARWRVVALVVAVLWIGAMLAGYAFDFLRTLGLV